MSRRFANLFPCAGSITATFFIHLGVLFINALPTRRVVIPVTAAFFAGRRCFWLQH